MDKKLIGLKALGLLVSPVCLLLAACGGGDSVAGAPNVTTVSNIALSASGATVTADYGMVSTANFVNDGDSTTIANYWAGNVTGDAVTIDFGRMRSVEKVIVYTNDTSFNSSSPEKVIEISSDNITWKTTAQFTGGDVSCPGYSVGSGKISCTFASPQSIQYFRVRITSATPSDQHIIEMEAIGR